MRDKQFKTLNEQIEILKEKGLIINDPESTKNILLKENYFFLSGYRYIFYDENKEKKFINGTTIEELHALFKFDRELRNIILKNIFIIENNMKSIFSYQLSKKYGYKEAEYLNAKNFTTDKERKGQLNDVLRKMKRQIRTNTKQHQATLHYLSNYGYIPLWVLVKVLSFGIISEFYAVLKMEDKKDIADVFQTDPDSLIDYLAILANYRNICAHEDILFETRTQRYIGGTKYHRELNIQKDEEGYIHGKNDLYSVIIIMKQMLNNAEFEEMMFKLNSALTKLDMNLNVIEIQKVLNKMGFPENWKEIKNIK